MPSYNDEGKTKALFCSVHKEDGMVSVISKRRTVARKKNKKIGNGVLIANKL